MKPQSMCRRTLPHWRLDGAIYFVTWRLDSSQPPLAPAERSLVRDALLFAAGKSFDLFAYVVMDDPVHVLVQPKVALERVIHLLLARLRSGGPSTTTGSSGLPRISRRRPATS